MRAGRRGVSLTPRASFLGPDLNDALFLRKALVLGGEVPFSREARGGLSGTNPGVGDSEPNPESTEGRPWGQPLKKPAGAPLNLG